MNIHRLAQGAERFIYLTSKVMGIVAIGILVAMMVFTDLDIFLRSFFNRPIPGDVEVIELAMVCTGFLGLGWCALKGMHVRVDLINYLISRRTRSLIDSIGYLLGLGICILFAWRSIVEGLFSRQMNNLSNVLEIPLYPFYWVVAVSYAVMILTILVLFLKSIKGVIK